MTEREIESIHSAVSLYTRSFDEPIKTKISESVGIIFNEYNNYDDNFDDERKSISEHELHQRLYNINEKSSDRKCVGAYDTPEDLCRYIIYNSIICLIDKENGKVYSEKNALIHILSFGNERLKKLLFEDKFIDPTCGTAEFLLNLFKIKLQILECICKEYTDDDILHIVGTIYGNDIDKTSTDVSKIRMYCTICPYLKEADNLVRLACLLNEQFSNFDFVLFNFPSNQKFECVIGNPPYVEYGKYNNIVKLKSAYGNIYANVIENSVKVLKSNGVLGFVVPLSYSSTPRMDSIRKFVYENAELQIILSYADRPCCLFQNVHQKLNVIFVRLGKGKKVTLTSDYNYWCRNERKSLFERTALQLSDFAGTGVVLKTGNEIEQNIYKKIVSISQNNIINLNRYEGNPVYLNMRDCFWIKCFAFNPGSKEYKTFRYEEKLCYLILCALNSSLFWMYWNIVSDCWHITQKDLCDFHLPNIDNVNFARCKSLYKGLEKKLQQTKKYVGTKQTEYEFKHKECLKEVDLIDDYMAMLYGLTSEELYYIKEHARKYRCGER